MHRPPVRRPIQHLPELLADQIAAGEVVERPASVVKELVENALDAGAGRIDIEVERGGMGLIRVRDDGCGIPAEELGLALTRHATSKVHSLAELERIASLGFRGEALASIASVSRLALTSRTADAQSGWRLETGADAPIPAAHPQGTSVEMRDLFYNTPARRKFLRSERTEFIQLHDAVRRIAVSHFAVGLQLRHNGRSILQLRPAADGRAAHERRLGEVLGQGFLRHARFLEFTATGLRLWGWVAGAEFSRSQADAQFFYVNGRSVRDRLVNHAVRRAFEGHLSEGRQPGFALYLELDSAQVDVNVHPTKHEVRFRDARLVHDFITSGLQQALGAALQGTLPAVPAGHGPEAARPSAARASRSVRRAPAIADIRQFYAAARAEPEAALRPLVRVGCFLFTEGAEGPGVLHAARAAERIASARLAGARAGEVLRAQPLLFPASLAVTAAMAEAGAAQGELLDTLGFDLTLAAPETVLIRAVPAVLAELPAAPLAQAVLEGVTAGEAHPELISRLEATAAEHLAGLAPAALLSALDSAALTEPGARALWRPLDERTLAGWFDAPLV